MSLLSFCETFLAAMKKGDYETQVSMMAPDFVVVEAESLPYGGTYRGIEGWKALTKAVIGCWSDFSLEQLEVAAQDEETVVFRFALKGTSRKTGKAFDTTVMELWRIKDGLLCEIMPYYFDTHALVAADTA